MIFTTSCKSQNSQTEFPIDSFEFKSIFGNKKEDKSVDSITHFSQIEKMYCLLGQGFFKTPRSENSDELLKKWLTEHPTAKVIPISILKSKPDITYCWIVDGTENLNIYLVKSGCYPGGTMQRPKTWREMSRKEKKIYRGTEKPNVKVLIGDSSYDKFIEELKSAELYAQENELGIWNEKKE